MQGVHTNLQMGSLLCVALCVQVPVASSVVNGGTGAVTLTYSYTVVSADPTGALYYYLPFVDFGYNSVTPSLIQVEVAGLVIGA